MAQYSYEQYRDWVLKESEIDEEDAEFICPPLDKVPLEERASGIPLPFSSLIEKCIFILSMMEEVTSADSYSCENARWFADEPSVQNSLSYFPFIVQHMICGMTNKEFTSKLPDKPEKNGIIRLTKFIERLSRYYMRVCVGEGSAYYTSDGDIQQFTANPEAPPFTAKKTHADICKGTGARKKAPSKNQTDYIKSRFGFDCDEPVKFDGVMPCSRLIQAFGAFITSTAQTLGGRWSFDAAFYKTVWDVKLAECRYEPILPETMLALKLYAYSNVDLSGKDLLFRFGLHPLIMLSVVKSFYLHDIAIKVPLEKVDPSIPERRAASQKEEEKTFRVEGRAPKKALEEKEEASDPAQEHTAAALL